MSCMKDPQYIIQLYSNRYYEGTGSNLIQLERGGSNRWVSIKTSCPLSDLIQRPRGEKKIRATNLLCMVPVLFHRQIDIKGFMMSMKSVL